MKISIIGAGIAGLVSAVLHAKDGHQVDVFEQTSTPGGKLNERTLGAYRFDTGPSLLTMPFVLEQVFAYCGEEMTDYLSLQPLSPLCKYHFTDGVRFENHSDLPLMLHELSRFAPEDETAYVEFLGHCAALYARTANAFIFNPLDSVASLKDLNIWDAFRIDAFKTVSEVIDRRFKSPHLRQFFKRFSTYNGSSPYKSPGTMNVIPYVELVQGGFYIKGGMYQLAQSLLSLGNKLGVTYHFNCPVERIVHRRKKVTGIITQNNHSISSDIVISNSDSIDTYKNLLDDKALPPKTKKKYHQLEPSCSGFVLLLGVSKTFHSLAHHTVFFSDNYPKEFKALFEDLLPAEDPTIYIANTSYSDSSHAPEGHSNLFVLVNTPYTTKNVQWEEKKIWYADHIIRCLEKRGLVNLSEHIMEKEIFTPEDFETLYSANRGSIYGLSSNHRYSAFLRPRNRSPHLNNLYLVGGGTHPGGGIPLVTLSALHAHKLIKQDIST